METTALNLIGITILIIMSAIATFFNFASILEWSKSEKRETFQVSYQERRVKISQRCKGCGADDYTYSEWRLDHTCNYCGTIIPYAGAYSKPFINEIIFPIEPEIVRTETKESRIEAINVITEDGNTKTVYQYR